MKIRDCYKVFFAEDGKGITSTAANHAANKAKELLKHKQSLLDNISFVNSSVALLSGGNEQILSTGVTIDDINKCKEIINEIGRVNSMIAWLREAISAKDNVYNDIKSSSFDEWVLDNDKDIPVAPKRDIALTASDVIGTWDENKRARYYALDAQCALLGKWIHPHGAFYKAKQELNDKISNPRNVSGDGRDAIIYTYTPSIDADYINSTYKEFADTLRRKEAEYNKLKAEIEKTVDESNIQCNTKYEQEYEIYRKDYNKLRAEFNTWLSQEETQAKNLKIRMPESVKAVYDTL